MALIRASEQEVELLLERKRFEQIPCETQNFVLINRNKKKIQNNKS